MPKQKTYKIQINRNPSSGKSPAKEHPQQHRISIRYKCANPLFERWLQEMLAKAESRESMSRLPLQKALASLRRYPLPIASGRDCFMLADFGKTICETLEKRLRAYRENGGSVRLDWDEDIERALNEEGCEVRRKLVPETEVVEEFIVPENNNADFEMPDDSVFDQLDSATLMENTSRCFTIANPKVILLVDTQEAIGKSKSSLDRTLKELDQYRIAYEVRRLSVGDFLWIVRDDNGREFILPYVVERKRMDDLASSIKDGRFHEQKFRLKQCGLANVIYLIEHLGNNRQVGVPASTLSQAVLNTLVQDFAIKYTENHHHTVLYLSTMSKLLNKNIKDKSFWNITDLPMDSINATAKDFNLKQKTMPLLAFETFNRQSSKTRDCSVKEIFMKQLLQIKLLSIDKVNAIVERYPTPRRLYVAYEKLTSEEEREKLLNIPCGPARKTVGLKLSKIIYQLFRNDIYQR
ncbi:crossover junction endonuclease MUS81 [Uranotaenia lowii]|uniref:crossover junction endonuclease MUS81 n=1 Tax=Uranotaenia lowii TaxID=190385 RepID=UPI00247B2C6A|nr:crossover junction endonuclease MUS81 [Uranotaenia lowii]